MEQTTRRSGLHRLGGLGERDVDANRGLLALNGADEVTDVRHADVLPALDADDQANSSLLLSHQAIARFQLL